MSRRVGVLVLRLALVGVIVALAIRYARGIDVRAIGEAVAHANPWLLALSGLGNLPNVWVKARRMATLLGGIGTARLMALYVTSYAADNLVMSQAGFGLRVAFLRLRGVPLATAASAQGIEKALEAVGLALTAGPFLWTSSLTWLRVPLVVVAATASTGLAILVVALPRFKHRVLRNLADGAAALKRPRSALAILALTLLGWLLEAAMLIAVLLAMRVEAPLLPAAALLLIAVNLAALIPGLPGNLGTFEVSASLALVAVGVPKATALSVALVYHALHTLPVTLAGLCVQRWARQGGSAMPIEDTSGTSSSTTNGK
jgi:uncharacterized membrane protein YbhN (UPF0104 family)